MSFKNYLKTLEQPSVVFTFGRFNPMHQEHYELTKFIQEYAKKNKMDTAVVYTSFSQNPKKNPLMPQDKILFLKKMVPQGVTVSEDGTLKNSFQILEDLIKNKKYTRIVFIVGEDRVQDFQSMYKYAKDWGIDIGSDIDFKIVQRKGSRSEHLSGTAMRQYVKDNNFETFKDALPYTLKGLAEEIFKKVKIGLGA